MEINNPETIKNEQFINVGKGVDRPKFIKDLGLQEKEEEPKYKVIETAWRDTPSVKNQLIKYPDTCKLDTINTHIFDLSNPSDLHEYSKLETKIRQENTNVLEIAKDRVFCEKTGNWKVYFQVANIKFKNIVPQGVKE